MSSDNEGRNVTQKVTAISAEFKDMVQAQMHIHAQHNTIVALTKEIQKLKSEKLHIESLLISKTPVISTSSQQSSIYTDDEETICRTQLRMLRDKSLGSELTLEEAKRVEIYTKILSVKLNQPKTLVVQSRTTSNDELLAAFEQMDENGQPESK